MIDRKYIVDSFRRSIIFFFYYQKLNRKKMEIFSKNENIK